MLVVRGVQIGQVDPAEGTLDDQRAGVAADGPTRPGHQVRHPQGQRPVGPGGPPLQVGHLETGGRVHPVGRLQQARDEDRPQRRAGPLVLDGLTHGVDAGPVLGPEVARRHTERLRDVAGAPGQDVQPLDGGRHLVAEIGVGVRVARHVAAGQHVGAAGTVDRGGGDPQTLEGLGHAGRATEEVERGAGPTRRRRHGQRGHQASFRPRVAGVGVEVVRDLAHDPVVGPHTLAQDPVGHLAEAGQHVVDVGLGGLVAVLLPHHHRHAAHLAVGHPARVVLVVPLGDPRRLAQLARPVAPAHAV